MHTIFENKSLRSICNAINTGLIETDEISIENLEIVSTLKPGIKIHVIEIDLKSYMYNMIKNSNWKTTVKNFETNFYDFVVFTETTDELTQDKTVLIMGLLELVLISPKIGEEGSIQERTEFDTNNNIWSLDTNEWNLICN